MTSFSSFKFPDVVLQVSCHQADKHWADRHVSLTEAINVFEEQFPDLKLSDITKTVMMAGCGLKLSLSIFWADQKRWVFHDVTFFVC